MLPKMHHQKHVCHFVSIYVHSCRNIYLFHTNISIPIGCKYFIKWKAHTCDMTAFAFRLWYEWNGTMWNISITDNINLLWIHNSQFYEILMYIWGPLYRSQSSTLSKMTMSIIDLWNKYCVIIQCAIKGHMTC